jgi:hypothetical protein
MVYSFGFLDVDHLALKKFLHMYAYKFEYENEILHLTNYGQKA